MESKIQNLVKEKIKKAKKLNWDQLNFTDLGLSDGDIPDSIHELTNLKKINLRRNNLEKIPQVILHMKNLEEINVNENHIKIIPKEIAILKKLKVLNINFNFVKALEPIQDNTNLKVLLANNNYIEALPSKVSNLKKLEVLELGNNKFTEFPMEIFSFPKLKELWLDKNNIKSLPLSFAEQNNKLRRFYINNNPIENIPPEIFNKSGNRYDHIENYLNAIHNEAIEEFLECRVIIVGDRKVGKTTLFKKLTGLPTDVKDRIKIERYDLLHEENTVKVNLWDFDKTEILNATHKFFFSNRCIYLLVWELDNNANVPYNSISRWVDKISVLGNTSPIICIMNKRDLRNASINGEHFTLSHQQLIKNYLKTDLSGKKEIGLNAAKDEIIYSLNDILYSRDLLPKNWIQIRNSIRSMEKSIIKREQYIKLIESHGVVGQKVGYLVEYLNDIGEVISFPSSILNKFIILDKNWLLEAIDVVLDHLSVNDKYEIPKETLFSIWRENIEYAEYDDWLFNVLLEFGICFMNKDKNIIFPQLLPPRRSFTAPSIKNILEFRLVYENYLPESIITRFICEKYLNLLGNNYGRNGCVLKIGNDIIDVLSDKKNISVKIYRDDFENPASYYNVTNTFSEIHNTFQGLKVKEYIKCMCDKVSDRCFFDKNKLEDERKKSTYFTKCNDVERSSFKVSIDYILKGKPQKLGLIKHIQNLISQVRQIEALQYLNGIIKGDNSYIVLLISKYKESELLRDSGLITIEKYQIEIRKINTAILNYLDRMEY